MPKPIMPHHRSALPKYVTDVELSNQSGFALVIALSLMAFVLVLLLSITTLVRVESSLSSQQIQSNQAKVNALLALNVALGELQKYAGPDQRVTARADITASIASSNSNQITYESTLLNPYLTAIWEATPAVTHIAGAIPSHNFEKRPAYLISGNEQFSYDITKTSAYPVGYTEAKTLIPLDDLSVELVSAPSARATPLDNPSLDSPSVAVRAPWVDINNAVSSEGRYAWWVGDEGIKARINLNEAPSHSSPEAEWLTPHSFKPQAVDPLLVNYDLSKAAISNSVHNLDLIVNQSISTDERARFFHDFSFHSVSLPVNVRDGGLKKDLSYGLDLVNPAPASISNDAYLFPRDLNGAPTTTNENLHFVQWGVLRDYYNQRPNSAGQIETIGYRSTDPSETGVKGYQSGINPVIQHYQLGFYADFDGDNLQMHYMPAVTLWNPYNYDLVFPQLDCQLHDMNGNGFIQVSIDIQNADFNGATSPNQHVVQLAGIFSGLKITIPGGVIPAGESKVYSPGSTGLPLGSNILSEGFTAGASYKEILNVTKINPVPDNSIRLKVQIEATGDGLNLRLFDPIATFHRSDFQYITGLNSASFDGFTNQWYVPEASFAEPAYLYMAYTPFSEDYYQGGLSPVYWASQLNPRATVHNNPEFVAGPYQIGFDSLVTELPTYRSGYYADVSAAANYAEIQRPGGVGNLNSSKAILYDIPNAPLLSLSQLSNANIMPQVRLDSAEGSIGIRRPIGSGMNDGLNYAGLAWSGAGSNLAPSRAIGSSHSNPYLVNLNETGRRFVQGVMKRDSLYIWDFSYLINDELFDSYFFSTISQSGGLETLNPLYTTDEFAPINELRNFNLAAKHIEVTGGFNVNSTSVDAWVALLSAYRGVSYGTSNTDSLFARFSNPVGALIAKAEPETRDADTASGYRRLTDTQVQNLAVRIVEQIKLRGPFPSMAAFVNRVLNTATLRRSASELSGGPAPISQNVGSIDLDEMVQLKGALQAALDLSDCNKGFYLNSTDVGQTADLSGTIKEKKGFYNTASSGVPGYLSQVDLLSALGSIMTVRSDTFTIRVAGESVDLNGKSSAIAYAEAVVQRRIDYTDPLIAAEGLPTAGSINDRFGRRFEIVSFKWLSTDEI